MGARKLAAYVHVDGRIFAPGDSPDKEFADQITNPKAWGESTAEETPTAAGVGPFDPSTEGVDEVNNYLADADEAEVKRVLAAETAGKKRKGIIEGPYAPEQDDA